MVLDVANGYVKFEYLNGILKNKIDSMSIKMFKIGSRLIEKSNKVMQPTQKAGGWLER